MTETLGADVDRLMAEGRLDEAAALVEKQIAQQPGDHEMLHRLALLRLGQKSHKESIALFERAIALAPQTAGYRRNFCEVLRGQGRLDEALAQAEQAVALEPENGDGYYNLGIIHYDRLEMDKAIAADRRAVALKPQGGGVHFELAEALLMNGQFEEGWKEYEWRWQIPGVPPLMPASNKPQWDGSPGKKVMLICDQGFGDTIQFCRFIPQVLARCPDAMIAASREMQPIVRQVSGAAPMTHRWEDLAEFDCYCPLSSLPMIFGTDTTNIPLAGGYLKPDADKLAYWKKKLDALAPPGYRRIGLAWAGRPTHGNDANRSMTLDDLKPLLELDDTVLISFQRGPAAVQLGRYFGKAPVINLAEDFPDVMAILSCVDRLVSVDTSMAHLAGALGRPVSVLLAYAPDWRWLLQRTDSPWYQSVTLHRQDRPGDWNSALAKLMALLKAS